jgi:hypothetical protein
MWTPPYIAAFDCEKEAMGMWAANNAARVKKARGVTDVKYRNIVRHLEYLTNAGKTSDDLTGLISELNAYVKHYKYVAYINNLYNQQNVS